MVRYVSFVGQEALHLDQVSSDRQPLSDELTKRSKTFATSSTVLVVIIMDLEIRDDGLVMSTECWSLLL